MTRDSTIFGAEFIRVSNMIVVLIGTMTTTNDLVPIADSGSTVHCTRTHRLRVVL